MKYILFIILYVKTNCLLHFLYIDVLNKLQPKIKYLSVFFTSLISAIADNNPCLCVAAFVLCLQ